MPPRPASPNVGRMPAMPLTAADREWNRRCRCRAQLVVRIDARQIKLREPLRGECASLECRVDVCERRSRQVEGPRPLSLRGGRRGDQRRRENERATWLWCMCLWSLSESSCLAPLGAMRGGRPADHILRRPEPRPRSLARIELGCLANHAHPQQRIASSRCSHAMIWFQPAPVWSTNSSRRRDALVSTRRSGSPCLRRSFSGHTPAI